ncbi:MAG: NADH-quinone oxidoreductase subunit L [Thermodesulfobacteriota bacterium]
MELLWLIPALPLTGFILLLLLSSRLPRVLTGALGTASVGLAALTTFWVAADFLFARPRPAVFTQRLWTWMAVDRLHLEIAFHLDALTLIMMLVITGVGFLIHLYSVGYMAGDKGYARFFAYMNLFVAAMLVLVLADSLPLLYLGWEGVGLCSYLLIGFWYENPANGYAARKAFVVTRVGDTAMAVGLFVLYDCFGVLGIQDVMNHAAAAWPTGSVTAVAVALLLLGGAVGKSAQLPLQTWLPDAMAGPTPVSALIHAATMVTAGVYLLARTHVIFLLAPAVLNLTAWIGAATLLLAGFSGLVQRDIKRVLAYSTISQLGYMFLALGIGAWSAAIFHLMTHAFFKALLFLCAGAVIHALGGEQDMYRMGGLKAKLPLTFWTFLVGAASLSALPLITAGFYSKDMIIWESYASPMGGPGLWTAAVAGALLTSLYTFRMVWLTFAGPVRTPVHHPPGTAMTLPLLALAALSLFSGFLEVPKTLGGPHLLSGFLHACLPPTLLAPQRESQEALFELISAGVALLGILWAWRLYRPASRALPENPPVSPLPVFLRNFWFGGWGFDRLYDFLLVTPYLTLARINRNDVIDGAFTALSRLGKTGHRNLARTQNGRLRTYAWGIGMGAAAVIAMVVLL